MGPPRHGVPRGGLLLSGCCSGWVQPAGTHTELTKAVNPQVFQFVQFLVGFYPPRRMLCTRVGTGKVLVVGQSALFR